MKLASAGSIIALACLTVGCGSHYYRVTDPASGKTYYTTDIDRQDGGAVRIKDERTRGRVTLPASEVTEISEDEYKAQVRGTGPIVIPPPVVTQPPVATQPPARTEPMR